jgi:transposase
MKPLSPNIVDNARQQLIQGKSARQVATNLNISISSALKIRRAAQENIPPPKMGRPTKITKETGQNMARQFKTGVLKSLQDGQRLVRTTDGEHVHVRTVQRHLKKTGVKAYVQQKRPALTLNHKKERYAFAQAHLHWTVDDWKNVMFSDESSISRVGSFGRKFYSNLEHKRYRPHQVMETKQHSGGKIMIWGSMTYHGVGDASWIQGKMNSEDYIDVLNDYVIASRDWYDMDPETFIFQQDNASVHTARIVMEYFDDNNITVLDWPACSPDLNPIEHLWSHLKKELLFYAEPPESMEELWERVQDVWTKIPIVYIQKLYESMPRRMEAVVRSCGGHTKY